tara:strand:- start:1718 stop:2137 length:420 start_codon:yes stop_codon:yes gene_type:complete
MMNYGEVPEKYDGFYFLPLETADQEGFDFKFFNLKEEDTSHESIEGNNIGDMYHICILKRNKNNGADFDDAFEAILGDPLQYVMNLAGTGLYGTVLRKTKTSGKWFQDYLTDTKLKLYNKKVTKALKSILGNKKNDSES